MRNAAAVRSCCRLEMLPFLMEWKLIEEKNQRRLMCASLTYLQLNGNLILINSIIYFVKTHFNLL